MRQHDLFLTVLLALGLLALTWFGWWLPNRPAATAPSPPQIRLNAVSFAPFRAAQSPLTGRFPSAAEVDADLALLAKRVRAIRTYAAIEGDYNVAALAAKHGLKLWLGIWLGQDRAQNGREIARGIAIARAWPRTVERVVVGNEVLLRRDLPPAELAAALDTVRAAVPEPVAYADVWEFWQRTPQIADHVDQVLVHLLPYWEDDPTGIDGAVAHVRAVYWQMRRRFPDKTVVIGETGWPSAGRWRRDAAPTRVNQALFLNRFLAAAAAEGVDYNLIEAFDQGWKAANEGTVGANWGLWTADRTAKDPPDLAVIDDPAWRWHAAAALALGLLLTTLTGFRRPVLAVALANALVFAWVGTVPIAYTPGLRLAAAVNLPAQALLALLLGRRDLNGNPLTAAVATQHLRALLRHARLPPRAAWLDALLFAFTWTAAVLQVLLVIDPRYRDFPTASFAVPLVAVLARALRRALPRGGGGREEAVLAGVLILGAAVSAVQEGPLNRQSLVWNAAVLLLATPSCLRLLAAARPRTRALPRPRPR